MPFTLPKLEYTYDALEPYIKAATRKSKYQTLILIQRTKTLLKIKN